MKLAHFVYTLPLTLSLFAAADTIKEQNFDNSVFTTGKESKLNHFNGSVTHQPTGVTDLPFAHNGITSKTGSAQAGVVDGKFHISHYSSSSEKSKMAFGNKRTGMLIFQIVDIKGFTDKHFSMKVNNIGSADHNDDVVVRMVLNKQTFITLLDTRSQHNGTVKKSTLTYSFKDSDTSAQLVIDILTDDDGDGYSFDNIIFTKNGNPAPQLTGALFGLGGISVILNHPK